jgi:hypothetical protein
MQLMKMLELIDELADKLAIAEDRAWMRFW